MRIIPCYASLRAKLQAIERDNALALLPRVKAAAAAA